MINSGIQQLNKTDGLDDYEDDRWFCRNLEKNAIADHLDRRNINTILELWGNLPSEKQTPSQWRYFQSLITERDSEQIDALVDEFRYYTRTRNSQLACFLASTAIVILALPIAVPVLGRVVSATASVYGIVVNLANSQTDGQTDRPPVHLNQEL